MSAYSRRIGSDPEKGKGKMGSEPISVFDLAGWLVAPFRSLSHAHALLGVSLQKPE
jgi:hypothetical protein